MSSITERCLRLDYLIAIIFLQIITFLTVFLDAQIARQILVFLYFTFLPGYIILKLLNLEDFGWTETLLFSVGFSVAFLMIAGLIISESFLLFGLSQPLSLVPLMLILNTVILIGGIVAYLRRKTAKISNSQFADRLQISPSMLLFLLLPVLSTVGAMYVNIYENNMLLLFTIVSISVLVICGVQFRKFLPSKLYSVAVVAIAVALLYHATLISNYIVSYGSDIPWEYYVFKATQNSGYWSSANINLANIGLGRFYSMLSITILPTIYSNVLNMDQMMFKIIFPLIFSLVPLGLYQLWQGYIGKKFAFIAAFFFMSQATFYGELISLVRQMIAELFFVLLLLVMLKKNMKPVNKFVCFTIFSFALVTSHYALAEIFLFFAAVVVASLIILRHPSRNITVAVVVFFLVIMFVWYLYTSGSSTFNSFLQFGDYVYGQLGNFFNPASRGQTVLEGLGLAQSPSLWNSISRYFAYITEGFVALGFIGIVTKRSKIHLDKEYYFLSLSAVLILALLIIVPGLANTLNMTRFFHILLFFLAPFCAIGADFLVKLFSKRDRTFVVAALLLAVLVPYFLFQTNFVFEVTGSQSWSVPLSGYRMNALQLYGADGYIDTLSAYGAQWLSTNLDFNKSAVYADVDTANNILSIYEIGGVNLLSNTTIVANNSVIYLSTINVVFGFIPSEIWVWNSSNLSHVFNTSNLVYVNGGSLIYEHNP
jgi:uncharacterized membrane protein